MLLIFKSFENPKKNIFFNQFPFATIIQQKVIDRGFNFHLSITLSFFSTFFYNNGATNTRDTIAISFSSIFKDGPAVSLQGSPTVSPTTPAA